MRSPSSSGSIDSVNEDRLAPSSTRTHRATVLLERNSRSQEGSAAPQPLRVRSHARAARVAESNVHAVGPRTRTSARSRVLRATPCVRAKEMTACGPAGGAASHRRKSSICDCCPPNRRLRTAVTTSEVGVGMATDSVRGRVRVGERSPDDGNPEPGCRIPVVAPRTFTAPVTTVERSASYRLPTRG